MEARETHHVHPKGHNPDITVATAVQCSWGLVLQVAPPHDLSSIMDDGSQPQGQLGYLTSHLMHGVLAHTHPGLQDPCVAKNLTAEYTPRSQMVIMNQEMMPMSPVPRPSGQTFFQQAAGEGSQRCGAAGEATACCPILRHWPESQLLTSSQAP